VQRTAASLIIHQINIINMANKIQISTIRKFADVQVIELNANFIARVVEGEILAKDTVRSLANLESACDEDNPTAEINASTLTYLRMDLEKVWNLLQGMKQAFLDEEPTTTCSPTP